MTKQELINEFEKNFLEIPKLLSALLEEYNISQEKVKIAAEKGDLRENSEYSTALINHSNLVIKLNETKERKEIGVDFLSKCTEKSIASLGSLVKFKYNEKLYEVLIVPPGWGDMDRMFLAVNSPVAEVLLGRVEGECVKFVNRLGKGVDIKIIEVS